VCVGDFISVRASPGAQGDEGGSSSSGRSSLLTKPAEYKVAFTLKDPDSDVPSIAVLDAGFGWPGAKPLFQGLRFSVDTGSRVAIVGPNGSGKVAIQKK
jgi:ATPase subunit of ABC transporter with duplicated ATPase domains